MRCFEGVKAITTKKVSCVGAVSGEVGEKNVLGKSVSLFI